VINLYWTHQLLGLKWEIDPLKVSSYFIYHKFYIQEFYVLSKECIRAFGMVLRKTTNITPYSLCEWFYNRDGVCLLRGTNLICKCNSIKSISLKRMVNYNLVVWTVRTDSLSFFKKQENISSGFMPMNVKNKWTMTTPLDTKSDRCHGKCQ
jgi:hypothetical protein